jgi:hypothetical protein
VHDGAADTTLIYDKPNRLWLMFYTNRRANVEAPGVAWVHGARIGVARSKDGGRTWAYRGEAKIPYGQPDYTHWAPELVTDAKGLHHMFLTIVPGTFADWNAAREIIHLTSRDLKDWKFVAKLDLGSDRVIDADVVRLPSGGWRMWYKDERDGSKIHFADSADLNAWKRAGVANITRGEGPVVFRWKDRWWMIHDVWKGLEVSASDDLVTWKTQASRLLETPGTRPTDRAKGQHADVVISGDRAFIIYFTHQENEPQVAQNPDWTRRTVLHAAELRESGGVITVDRDRPTLINLGPARRR